MERRFSCSWCASSVKGYILPYGWYSIYRGSGKNVSWVAYYCCMQHMMNRLQRDVGLYAGGRLKTPS